MPLYFLSIGNKFKVFSCNILKLETRCEICSLLLSDCNVIALNTSFWDILLLKECSKKIQYNLITYKKNYATNEHKQKENVTVNGFNIYVKPTYCSVDKYAFSNCSQIIMPFNLFQRLFNFLILISCKKSRSTTYSMNLYSH